MQQPLNWSFFYIILLPSLTLAGVLSGYLQRTGSVSPPPRHGRLDDSRYDPSFERPTGPHVGRGFRGGRGGGRFRDVSPHDGFGRGGRSLGRGYDVDRRGTSPFDGEYIHRNDPNLSPREGDWICANPRCGNLNFARRTYCNNCNEPRFATGRAVHVRSPRRGHFASPPHGSPPVIGGLPIDRGTRRNFNGYRSPPRGWGSAEGPTDFGMGSPPPRRGGRFQDHTRRDNRLEYEDEYPRRGNWPVDEGWDRRDAFTPERRGFDRRPPSPLARDRWVRERSRSPVGSRLLKGPYMGRGRDDRRYDDPYVGRGRGDDPPMGRGRGFRRSDDSFAGRGRGEPRGMGRGRNNGGLY